MGGYTPFVTSTVNVPCKVEFDRDTPPAGVEGRTETECAFVVGHLTEGPCAEGSDCKCTRCNTFATPYPPILTRKVCGTTCCPWLDAVAGAGGHVSGVVSKAVVGTGAFTSP